MSVETAGGGDKQSLGETTVEVKEEPGGQDYLQVKEGGEQMRKEIMVEVKKEVLAELNVKEENIDENEYMEVDKAEIKNEEKMSERETNLQKTVSKLLKKSRKRKDRLKAERRKVRALEQEVEELRTRLQFYENTEEGGKEVYEKETSKDENNAQERNNREKREDEQEDENEKEREEVRQTSERVIRINKGTIRYRETDSEESGTEDSSEESKSYQNKKSKTFGSIKIKKKKPSRKICDADESAMPSTTKAEKMCERGFRCGEEGCGERFSRRKLLEDHGRTKHGNAKLRCTEPGCDKEYFYYNGLNQHKQFIHQGKAPCPCMEPGCDRKFIDARHLQDHRRSVHQEPKLKCTEPDCGQEFMWTFGLRRHTNNIHKKLKPHKCQQGTCQRKFYGKECLKDHCRSKHGAPKLNCKMCNKQFIFATHAYKHMRQRHWS